MRTLRRLGYATLVLAFAQIVFGAIVRITGSGLGCGDHWPKCNGEWFPPHDRIDLIIEITHRYIAAALTLAIIAYVVVAMRHRTQPGVSGPGGVRRPVVGAAALVIIAALFGMVTVKMDLNPFIIVTHLAIAVTLLSTLAMATVRAGGFGSEGATEATARTIRSTTAAVIIVFCTLVLGGFTANIIGAPVACRGFPACRSVEVDGTPLVIHIIHRGLAFLLFFHMIGVTIGVHRRREPGTIRNAARMAMIAVTAQIVVAAIMVELALPPVWRSVHQAMGTLVWLAVVILALVARRRGTVGVLARRPAPQPSPLSSHAAATTG
jgi:heme a synthase